MFIHNSIHKQLKGDLGDWVTFKYNSNDAANDNLAQVY